MDVIPFKIAPLHEEIGIPSHTQFLGPRVYTLKASRYGVFFLELLKDHWLTTFSKNHHH